MISGSKQLAFSHCTNGTAYTSSALDLVLYCMQTVPYACSESQFEPGNLRPTGPPRRRRDRVTSTHPVTTPGLRHLVSTSTATPWARCGIDDLEAIPKLPNRKTGKSTNKAQTESRIQQVDCETTRYPHPQKALHDKCETARPTPSKRPDATQHNYTKTPHAPTSNHKPASYCM